MSEQENKDRAERGYRAFAAGDAAAAMENIDDSAEWVVNGNSSLTGTYKGKQEIGELWAKLTEKGMKTEPHDFIADGDKVVVLTTVSLDGETEEAADILTYDSEGKLIRFDQIGDPAIANRVFA
jgi:uncharacterized protein